MGSPQIRAQISQQVSKQAQIERLFETVFFSSFRTVLIGGAEEPLYQPAKQNTQPHKIFYRADYLSSALHEVAHWCLAGDARRQLVDFGYWYEPDGRSAIQQQRFEKVEIKPQALEWIFSVAAGHKFVVSVDNLSAEAGPSETFIKNVCQQAQYWCKNGLPNRPALFVKALVDFFGTHHVLTPLHYKKLPEEQTIA